MEFRKTPKTSRVAYFTTLLVTGLTGFFFVRANPLLYSQELLKERTTSQNLLKPKPLLIQDLALIETQTIAESIKTKTSLFLSRRFRESERKLVALDKNADLNQWLNFESGFLISDQNLPEIHFFSWEGTRLWQFENEKNEGPYHLPVKFFQNVVLSHPNGEIISLTDQGQKLWFTKLSIPLAAPPIVIGKDLFVIGFEQASLRGWRLSGKNGEVIDEYTLTTELNEKPIKLSAGINNKVLISDGQKVVSWSLTEKMIVGQTEFESPPIGFHAVDDRFSLKQPLAWVVPIEDGRVYGLDELLSSIWEVDLGSPIIGAGNLIPKFDRGALTTENHYVHIIQLSDGRRIWRFNLENKEKNSLGWTAQLQPALIEQLELPTRFEGWALWQTCLDQRICIFNPDGGQIVGRIILNGVNQLPPFIDSKGDLRFLLQSEDNWYLSFQEGR